jgi:UDP-glucose 4-epimerase
MTVLITGGAGYIGSHMGLALADAGVPFVVVDDLRTGRAELVPAAARELVIADVGDTAAMGRLMRRHGVTAVVHFAGSTVVPESVSDPLGYYGNNTAGTRALLEACVAAGVGAFLFSSTAAVYGSARSRVDETAPVAPEAPYGRSKLMAEQMLRDAAAAHGLRFAILRYFNVAGADPALRAGQATPNATHLIKVAVEAAVGRREGLTVFGTDYPTADGTGVRDFIHVADLVEAHRLALDHLDRGGDNLMLNCGYGRGYSVRDVIAAVERHAGGALDVAYGPRRPGDIAELIAEAGALRQTLGWRPMHDSLDTIVATALAWEKRLIARPLTDRPAPARRRAATA